VTWVVTCLRGTASAPTGAGETVKFWRARAAASIAKLGTLNPTKLIDNQDLGANLADCDEGGPASDLSNISEAARTCRTGRDGVI
jgi:hypothetical protein